MAKRFYFRQEKIKYSKMYGYCVYRCYVYRLRKEDGMPQKIGHIDYQTGSTRGAVNEVFYFLTEKGLIPKKYYEKSAYHFNSGAYDKYPIYEMM